MAAEAQKQDEYNQQIVQVMKEHDLIDSEEEEEQITTYLLIAQ